MRQKVWVARGHLCRGYSETHLQSNQFENYQPIYLLRKVIRFTWLQTQVFYYMQIFIR